MSNLGRGAQAIHAQPSSGEVGVLARLAAVWSGIQIILRNLISIFVTAILARILVPEDYGLVAMVVTLTALLQVFSDMGLSWATVQRKNLTVAQVSGLFWINLGVGGVLWLVVAGAGPMIADFYDEPDLSFISIAVGAGFLISGAAVQPMALMKRALDFRRIALIEITALICGAFSAVALALAGWGYWALIFQGLVNASVRTVLALNYSSIRILPPGRADGLGQLVSFGGLLALNGVFIYFARNLDNILIAKVWGAAELGIYNRAYFLMLLPSMLANGVLSGLMVSSLSAFHGDLNRFGSAYRRALRLVAYVGTPIAVGLALTAGPAVELVYGPNWSAVVPILLWLSLAGITQPIYNTTGWLFTAAGKGWTYLWLTVASTVLLGAVFFWMVSSGTVAVAMGYGLVMGIVIPMPALWLAHRAAGISFRPTLAFLMPVVLINAVMAAGVWVVAALAQHYGMGQMLTFALQVVTGIVIYLALTPIILNDMMKSDLAPYFSRFRNKANT